MADPVPLDVLIEWEVECADTGDVANSPAATVVGRPARWTVPTARQCVPSADW